MAIDDHMKILFHWPKKSAVDWMGKKKPNGITKQVAVTTLSLYLRLVCPHFHKIAPTMTSARQSPIMPVSPKI